MLLGHSMGMSTSSVSSSTLRGIPIVASASTASPPQDGVEAANTVYVRATAGRFANWRWAMLIVTQLVFYGLPWLQWNGRQAVLFDLGAQRFYLLGLVLYPQDLIYLTVLLVLCAMGLFFATALFGRVWCGFSCPQTVYTKLFLWIERLAEGKPLARQRLDAGPWNAHKLLRKGTKHGAWLSVSLWTGITLVAYFTPMRVLWQEVLTQSLGPWELFWMLFYGLATYGNAGFLREQVCKHMCPYARFQGAMLDAHTLVIGYDVMRGEPRGAHSRKALTTGPARGDCVDCSLCVQVCPTGIDIRNGLQSNCIGCAACIDACDTVMDKTHTPRGLIRYAAQSTLSFGQPQMPWRQRVVRPRVLVYGTLMLLCAVALSLGLSTRSPVRLDVVRDRGVMARVVGAGTVENIYRLHLMNASEHAVQLDIALQATDPKAPWAQTLRIAGSASSVVLEPVQARTVVLRVQMDAQAAQGLAGQSVPFAFVGRGPRDALAETLLATEKASFYVPR